MDARDFEISPEAFEARQIWARRNGKVLWLWPDVAPPAWRGALEALEAVVRQMLSGAPARLEGPRDIPALSLAAYTSGVGPLVGYWIEKGLVVADADAAALLALHLDHNRRRMAMLAERARDVVGMLAASGVDVTVLKGMHLAFAYFPEPGTRPVSDIDLLTGGGADQEVAEEILASSGFELISRNYKETTWALTGVSRSVRSLLLAHAEDPWSIDLHHSIDQKPASGASRTSLDKLVAPFRASDWPLDRNATTLAQPALLLHLASHIGAAVRVNLSLVRLVDLALVIRRDSQSGNLDWDAFIELGTRSRALGIAFPALALVEKLAPGTVPAGVIEICAQASPPRVRQWVRDRTPAGAQCLDSSSLRVHYMWASGALEHVRQIGADLVPDLPWRQIPARYGEFIRRALRRGFTR
jgi:hypothetical protein